MFSLILAVLASDDTGLLDRLARREPQALAELYDRYGAVVYRLIFRMVRDPGAAEDLVQETFLRVWNRAAGFDSGRGAVAPWLLAVARNRAIDYLRYQARRCETADLNETEHPALFADFTAGMPQFDLAEQIRRALERLTPEQRLVIELAYFEGLSQSEIAQKIRQPLGTVKTWMRRAMQSMREGLKGAAAV